MRNLMLVILILFSPVYLYATELTVTWDSNTESDIAGYIVYHNTDEPAIVWHPVTEYKLNVLDGLHIFRAKAFDWAGNTSDYSEPVAKMLAPEITGDVEVPVNPGTVAVK
jgi:hypothetical protein